MFSIIINFAAVYHRLYSVRSSFRELFFLATTIEFEEQETLIHSCNVNVTMYYHIYRCSNICYVCWFPEKVEWIKFFNPRKVPSCSLGVSRTYITIIKQFMGFLIMKLWEGVASAFRLFLASFHYFVKTSIFFTLLTGMTTLRSRESESESDS